MIEFFVDGEPVPKARPRFRRAGDKVFTYTPKKTADYEQYIQWHAKQAGVQVSDLPVLLDVIAYCPIPQSKPKKWKEQAEKGLIEKTSRPDADNYAKIAMDALNGIAWKDDGQVVELYVRKRYVLEENAGLLIKIDYIK